MLSEQELTLLYELAAAYDGRGDIIDAGAFLGGSTIALAAGLRDNPMPLDKRRRIHSYDYFRADRFTRNYLPDAEDGTSTRPHYDGVIAGVRELIDVHEGDIAGFPWPAEREVNILFIDIAKSWATNDVVVQQFFPRLIPDVSTVIQQDYHWPGVPWLPITMELFADRFTYLGSMPAASAVYRCRARIAREEIPARLRDLPNERLLSLLAQAQRWPHGSWEWTIHQCNEVSLRLWLGQVEAAAEIYQDAVRTSPVAIERLQFHPPALVSRLP
jgi:hypothetical protein